MHKHKEIDLDHITLGEYLRKEYGMIIAIIGFVGLFCYAFACNMYQRAHESDYNVATARYVDCRYYPSSGDEHRSSKQYTELYKYSVNGHDYLYETKYFSDQDSLPDKGHKILLRYLRSDPKVVYEQVQGFKDYMILFAILGLTFVIPILVSNYIELKEGPGYSEIVFKFLVAIFFIIGGIFIFYILTLQNGYYSFVEGFHQKTRSFIVSFLLMTIGIIGGIYEFRIIKDHNQKKAQKKKKPIK